MCTYSVAAQKTRKAATDDQLVATKFPHAVGFALRGDDPSCATCLETGTTLLMKWDGKIRTGTFREDEGYSARRDWIVFDGIAKPVSIQDIPVGTSATVVSLTAAPRASDAAVTRALETVG